MKEEHTLFLAFGANLGDKEENIISSYNKIEERIGEIEAKSAFYVTQPEGFESDSLFVNSVCKVRTELDVYAVFEILREIEKELGRAVKSLDGVYSDRFIDIDILMYDDLIIDTLELVIPHPRFHLRKFVLQPFAEIAPETVHPVLGITIEALNNKLH